MLKCEDIIYSLKPCQYRYNDIKIINDKINYGFIAQDLLNSFGEEYNFVVKDKTGYLMVNYDQFISPMVKVIQLQKQKIEELENRIKIIEEKNNVNI